MFRTYSPLPPHRAAVKASGQGFVGWVLVLKYFDGGFMSALSLFFFWLAVVAVVVIAVPLLAAVLDFQDVRRQERARTRREHPTRKEKT
jgi:heme exporter protein D